jgi:hypothetical protein
MNTAVLERRVSQKTRNRTRGFEELKPQVKVNIHEHGKFTEDDYPEIEYELTEEGKIRLEKALEDIRNGNVYVLATPKNWKG